MHIGYARVSTQDQDLRLQYDALHEAQCDKIYRELIWDTHKLGTQYLILRPLFWFRKFLFIHRKRGKPALTFGIIPELSIVSPELVKNFAALTLL